ncbi:MAG TPA: di-heme oxidoredictase family protein [Gemmataceae bacterium]|nr:di-heme oxidoredictase family protein [Gemmataceae bacterium]
MRLNRLSPSGQRKLVGLVLLAFSAGVVYWSFFSDGLPIIWGPSASASEIAAGKELFEHEWTPNDPLAKGDGLGPVFNAKSCASCHFQGGLGGGGAIEHNVLNYEVAPRPNDPAFQTGTVHNFSTDAASKETLRDLRAVFPTVKGRTIAVPPGHCGGGPRSIPDFDPVRTESIQTTALFGAGWIDLISDRAILRNARNRGIREAARELQLEFDNVPVGRVRHVAGGVGKFGWKGQFATLSEFVAAACANEIGLGTPTSEQAKPLRGQKPADVKPDLDRKQFRSLVAFVKTLPRPVESDGDATAKHGKELFTSIGCAVCHVPNMGGVKNVYSDFLLYTLDDPAPPVNGGGRDPYDNTPPPELNLPTRPDNEPKPSEWKTPPLWGVADSAPYLHDGSAATLRDAITRHRGDAKSVSEKFTKLSAADQAAVVAFLNTLKAPPDAPQLSDPATTRLVRR